MRVIVWGINYPPELTGIAPFNAALCEFLAERCHEVTMVTSFPYYPEWKKREEDKGSFFRTDRVNNVSIFRCWSYVPSRVSALRRMIHEASFVALSLLRVLFLPRPAVYVVVSPPLLLGVAAWCASVIKRSPFVFHVQDLQPDAALSLGMLRKGLFVRLLYGIESFAYSRAKRVSAISSGIGEKLHTKGVQRQNIVLFPNGVRLPVDLPKRGCFRRRHGIPDNTFLAVYSGNIGVKQGLDVLVDAGRILESNGTAQVQHSVGAPIVIVIAGDGARRAILWEAINRESLRCILLLPLLPELEYLEMLADADCTVITQQRDTGEYFFPSKLLSAVAAAKPVLSVADEQSELAKAVRRNGLGVNVSPGSPELVVESLRMMASGHGHQAANDLHSVEFSDASRQDSLAEMGRAGLEFAAQFEMNRVLSDFENELKRINASRDSVT